MNAARPHQPFLNPASITSVTTHVDVERPIMTRTPDTPRDELATRVHDAALALRAEGHRPSVARVRAWITERYGGAGDQRTLKDLVAEVTARLAVQDQAGDPAHAMPDGVRTRVEAEGRALWRAAVEAAEEAFAERRRRADEEVVEAEGARTLAEDQLEGEQSRTAAAEEALEAERGWAKELERTADALRIEVAAERERAGAAERRADEERSRLEDAVARAQAAEAEARAAREEAAAARREGGERVAAAEGAVREVAAEAAAAGARAEEAARRIDEAAARAEAAERDRDTQVGKLEAERDAATARAERAAERADRRLGEMMEQLSRMASRLAPAAEARPTADQEA